MWDVGRVGGDDVVRSTSSEERLEAGAEHVELSKVDRLPDELALRLKCDSVESRQRNGRRGEVDSERLDVNVAAIDRL